MLLYTQLYPTLATMSKIFDHSKSLSKELANTEVSSHINIILYLLLYVWVLLYSL